jgi:hypothetical protein
MNRDETKNLMLHVNGVFGLRRPPEAEEVDRWHHMLVDVDEIIARRAVRDMAETDPGHAPTLAKMLAALNRPTERRPGPVAPIASYGCEVCEGTGFMRVHDPDVEGLDAVAPCYLCQADHPWHKNRRRHAPKPANPERDPEELAHGRSIIQSIRDSLHRHPAGHHPPTPPDAS